VRVKRKTKEGEEGEGKEEIRNLLGVNREMCVGSRNFAVETLLPAKLSGDVSGIGNEKQYRVSELRQLKQLGVG
jgi:hypothetical protein